MIDLRTSLYGLWLPLITPFRHGELDETSLRRLVRHYTALPVNGMILAATTGESLTLTSEETERLAFTVRDEAGKSRNLPLLLGLSGSNTRALLEMLERTAGWGIDGYLISCPYYSRRPDRQRGAEAADDGSKPRVRRASRSGNRTARQAHRLRVQRRRGWLMHGDAGT